MILDRLSRSNQRAGWKPWLLGALLLGGPAAASPAAAADPPHRVCAPSATTLCLGAGSRFVVTAAWRTPDGRSGSGQAVALTADTGYFWFFSSSNVEAVIKVLDACSFNQRFWVFAGGLTNVQVDITVTDTSTGQAKTYHNAQSTAFRPIQDTQALPCAASGLPPDPGEADKLTLASIDSERRSVTGFSVEIRRLL